MRPVAVYSALRVGLFLAVLLVLRVLGVGGVLSLVLAVVLALLLSFLVLRRQRDAVTRALIARQAARQREAAADPSRRRRTLKERLAEDAEAEDAAVERVATNPASTDAAATNAAAIDAASIDAASIDAAAIDPATGVLRPGRGRGRGGGSTR